MDAVTRCDIENKNKTDHYNLGFTLESNHVLPSESFRTLVIREIEYAAALRCLLAGDDLSKNTKERLRHHAGLALSSHEVSPKEQKKSKNILEQCTLTVMDRVKTLQAQLNELQHQEERLKEIQKKRYPAIHNASIESLVDCLQKISVITSDEMCSINTHLSQGLS